MKILVSGGGGFIGSHLVDALIESGHEVVVVDNFSTGRRWHLEKHYGKVKIYQYDIADKDLGMKLVFEHEKIEFVYHLAAAARIPWCTEHVYESNDININATVKLLELAKENNVKGFVFASSSSVYGNSDIFSPISEITKINPLSFYALQKYAGEQYVKFYYQYHNLPTVALRFFNVYGTNRQSADGAYPNVFASFYRDMQTKGKITIYGDGEQKRDFVHVYDIVNALQKFTETKYLNGEIYNVGTGKATSVNEIAFYFNCEREYRGARLGDPAYSCANYSKLNKHTGWNPTIDVEKGVNIFLNSFENKNG